jgi:hypothetical protein
MLENSSSSQVMPLSFFCAMVSGMMIVSSWSCSQSDKRGHYLTGKAIDAYHFPDGILHPKELIPGRAANRADIGSAIHIVLRENRALIHVPALEVVTSCITSASKSVY